MKLRRATRIPSRFKNFIVTERISYGKREIEKESSKNFSKKIKTSIYFVIIDEIIAELTRRFGGKESTTILDCISCMSPKKVDKDDFLDVKKVKKFCNLFNLEFSEAEITVARNFLANNKTKLEKKNSLLDVLDLIPKDMFPKLTQAYQVAATLPVTSACCERSFSCLLRLKNYLRTTMGQDRLSSLGILQIEAEEAKDLCTDCIIDRFAEISSRRIQLRHPSIVHNHN